MKSPAKVIGMRSRVPNLLLAAVLLLVSFLLGYLLLSGYREQVRRAEIGTRNLATLLQTRLHETLRRADADLAALAADLPEASLDARNVVHFRQDIGKRLSSRLINVDCMEGLHVVDAQGRVLYSTLSIPAPEFSVAERDYFKALRADDGTGLAFSRVVKSGLTGRDVLVVARAIRNDGGRFLGAVLGPLDLNSYRKQIAALEVGPNGFVALRRRENHAFVIGWPEAEEVNVPLEAAHPFVTALAGGNDDATVGDWLAGSLGSGKHVISLKGGGEYPFYFAVGFDRDGVLAGWYSQVMVVGVALLVAVALVGGLVMRLGRMRVRETAILSDLAYSELQFRQLVQLVPVGIARFDSRGKCVFVNDRNLVITGRKREDLVGNDWLGFVHPDDKLLVAPFWNGESDDDGIRTCEYRLINPDGRVVDVIGEATAERNADGAIVGHVVAQTDISLLKSAQKELMRAKQEADRANQAKTRFLAAASHDLRQPIQAIDLFKDALCRTELNDEQKTIVRFLSLSVGSLSGLIYSLLDISKLDAGLVQPKMNRVDVESVFEAVDDEFSSLAQQENLRFKFFYPFNSPVLKTDPALLLTVLRNLIDNALKYTNSGGILVGFRRRNNAGVIQVWDTGIGIDPVFGEKVFEECFQVGNSTGDRARGVGIGLSIARRTARLLGGDVNYRSRIGRGSVFEITVPLSLEPSDVVASASCADGGAPADIDCSRISGWTVVVIEDDLVVAKSIELSLQTAGISTRHFSTAEEAIADPSLLEADFYISDFVLPGRNGIELLDAIQARAARAINAVLVTGETSPERMESARASGWNILHKPAGLTDLLSLMTNAGEAERAPCRN